MLAKVYEEQNKYDKMLKVLQKGYQKTKSEELKDKIKELKLNDNKESQ
ncbi:hypothetical protein [Sporohalobacter salinus]|nr:hypothetical protein [Sporohalobacter salinus]MBM7625132.1 hypothetical protein [Sporohalobacter salinus]